MNQRPEQPRRGAFRRWARRLVVGVGVLAGAGAAYAVWAYRGPAAPVEIFRGVTYSCEDLPDEAKGGGLLYLVRVDLTAPGVGIFVTPTDAGAVSSGWEYRLQHAGSVVRDRRLAVAVNGTLFSDNSLLRMAGDNARAIETAVSDHQVNHVCPYCWLLWFDDDLTPHVGDEEPPGPGELRRARWGIGSQARILQHGQFKWWAETLPDHRTVLAIDPARKLLWLACFRHASYQYAARIMSEHGATDAVMLDGGTSTAMAIGPGASGVREGVITGDWRPVANHFGIFARPLGEH